jgi:hypothetical protein
MTAERRKLENRGGEVKEDRKHAARAAIVAAWRRMGARQAKRRRHRRRRGSRDNCWRFCGVKHLALAQQRQTSFENCISALLATAAVAAWRL